MKKLYVGNLPFQANLEELSNWFNQAGVTPGNVTLVQDRFTGQPRGFGFVEVDNDDDANRAIQSLNGQDFMGRKLVVNEARPREGGGGGGRGRWELEAAADKAVTWQRTRKRNPIGASLCSLSRPFLHVPSVVAALVSPSG